MNFNDFWGSRDAKIDEKSIKNLKKFEAQDEVPPGIDFSWILVDFGRHVGRKKRTKMEPRSIPKSNENLIGILEASWGDLERQVGLQGGGGLGRMQRRGVWGGPFNLF